MKAFLFWYKSSENATTEYINIIAYTLKQAYFLFANNGYTNMYDYGYACDYIEQAEFKKAHNIGEILGQNAII